ncbi:Protein FAM47E [Vulpes lagopus]
MASTPSGISPKKTSVSHPGQWLNEGKKLSETDLFHEDGPLLHENVHKGVRDFCNWATAFGSSNIDEEFILKQFDIDYQSKPSHDVPHTRRLNQVPLELKKRVGLKKLQKPQFFQKLDYEQKHQKPQAQDWCWITYLLLLLLLDSILIKSSIAITRDPHNAKCVKMRYGAWYLDTKLWKKQRADERLLDPKVSCRAQDENFKRELQEQFLEKMYIRKERKCDCNKTSIK